jgi:8-oxo-dGTP pyrophosphatase MutT (NUDIX family)
MAREISSGGVVIRPIDGVWHVALIEPRKDEPTSGKPLRKSSRAVLALPKGLVDPGERPEATAIREVKEETGIVGEIVTKLTDIKYVYTRTWGDHERVFKVVSFYLLRYISGEIDDLVPEMRIEVNRALWLSLSDAQSQLAYGQERKVMQQVEQFLAEQGLQPQSTERS